MVHPHPVPLNFGRSHSYNQLPSKQHSLLTEMIVAQIDSQNTLWQSATIQMLPKTLFVFHLELCLMVAGICVQTQWSVQHSVYTRLRFWLILWRQWRIRRKALKWMLCQCRSWEVETPKTMQSKNESSSKLTFREENVLISMHLLVVLPR